MANRIFIGDAAFTAAIGFLAGAFAADMGWKGAAFAGAGLLAAGIGVSANGLSFGSVRRATRRLGVILAAIAAVFFAAGFFYCHFRIYLAQDRERLPPPTAGSFRAIVDGWPASSWRYLTFQAILEAPFSGEITVFARPGSGAAYGDEVLITGKVLPPRERGQPPAVFPRVVVRIATHRASRLREALLSFRAAVFRKITTWVPGTAGALLGGETLGGTEAIGPSLKTDLSVSGTSYIVSMYGYKIAVIAMVIELALGFWAGRRTRSILAAAAVGVLVLMTGGNISAVRAAVMAWLALAAKWSGRVFDPRNALAASAAGMTFADPHLPADPAFVLSVLSVAGMFYLARPLERFFGWGGAAAGRWSAVLREATIVAVASLLPIIPVIAVSFGDFSLMSFPSNILIAPSVPPAALAGTAVAAAGFLAPPAAPLVAKLAETVLLYQLAVIRLCAKVVLPAPPVFGSAAAIAAYFAALLVFIHIYDAPRRPAQPASRTGLPGSVLTNGVREL